METSPPHTYVAQGGGSIGGGTQPPGNSTSKIVITLLVVFGVILLAGVITGGAVIVWKMWSRPTQITLTPEDMSTIASDQPAPTRNRLATDEAFRKEFAKNVRELLAVAEEAKLKGVAARPDIKRQTDIVRALVISQDYAQSKGGSPDASISDADVEAFFKERGKEEEFNQFFKDAQANNPQIVGQQIPEEQKKEIRRQFGQVQVGARRGIAEGIDKKRNVALQIMLEQARLLASTYAKDSLVPATKATEQEINTYLAGHPENKDREQARRAVEEEKEKNAIAEIVKRQGAHINVAENFSVKALPDSPPASSSP